MKIHKKINIHTEHIKIFVLIGLIVLIFILIKTNNLLDKTYASQPVEFGASFSPNYTQALGLNPRVVYQEILKDLEVKYIRLPAYWPDIEPEMDKYNFGELDYYINEAGKNNVNVILAIGYKLPRWPECRAPGWLNLESTSYRQKRQLKMMEVIVKAYEKNPFIKAWQVENEPTLKFGICPGGDDKFLKEEVKLVRSLSQKPIILTDSGELQTWITPMQLSDYFGTTLYRIVHDKFLGRIDYPLKPWFYRTKGFFIKNIFAPKNQKLIITELQAEPWTNKFVADVPLEEQVNNFPLQQLKDNVEFAKKVGYPEIYLWGAEWWYYMKVNNHPEYWEFAKDLF